MSARVLRLAGFGLVLGFVLGASRLADPAYIVPMLSFGAAPGGGGRTWLLAWATLAEAALLAGLGFRAFERRGFPPRRPIRSGTVPGAVLFGTGWALTGTCPAAALRNSARARWRRWWSSSACSPA